LKGKIVIDLPSVFTRAINSLHFFGSLYPGGRASTGGIKITSNKPVLRLLISILPLSRNVFSGVGNAIIFFLIWCLEIVDKRVDGSLILSAAQSKATS
jgi:hypothetical protein